MKIRNSALIVLAAMLISSWAAHADSLTSSGSATVSVTDTVQVSMSNCGGSSNVCSQSQTPGTFANDFSITVPGITLPTGATITGATLSYNFAPTSGAGGFSTTSLSEVSWGYSYYAGTVSCGFLCNEPVYDNYYYSYYGPSYNVSGNLSGSFTSISSPDGSSSLFSTSSGTLDLLALGFGSDLAAGDSLSLTGIADSDLNFGLYSTGFNANTTSNLYVDLTSGAQAAGDRLHHSRWRG